MHPLAPLGKGLCPIPSAYLTFHSVSGAPHVLTAAWVGVVCSRPAILSITLPGSCGLSEQWPQGGEFALNMPSDEQISSGPLARLDVTLEPGAKISAPVIAECPVRIECRGASFFSRHGQRLLSGEVVVVQMGERIHGLDGPVDLCRLKPFALPLGEGRTPGFEGIIPIGLEAASLSGAPS